MMDTPKLSKKDIEELRHFLVSWEDDNISDYKYCNSIGDILGLGKWTCKGSKGNGIDLGNPHGSEKEMLAEEWRVEVMINKIMETTKKNLDKKEKKIFDELVGDKRGERVLRSVAYWSLALNKDLDN